MRRFALVGLSVLAALLTLLAAAPAGTGEATRRGEIRIRELRVPGSRIPIEGEIAYARVTNASGTVVKREPLPFGGMWIRVSVRTGTYRLDVWHRTCNANCNHLDPPSDRCHASVPVRPGAVVRLTVRNRPGSPCRIVRTR